MKNLKIFQILDNFSSKELKDFKKFLKSGLNPVNKNYESIVNLYIKRKKYFRTVTTVESVDFISTRINIKKSSLNNRLSELNKLGELFLSYVYLKNEQHERNLIMLDIFEHRKSFTLFDRKSVQEETLLKNGNYDSGTLRRLAELYESASYRYLFDNKYDKYLEYFKLRVDYRVLHFLYDAMRNSFENYQQKSLDVYESNLLEGLVKSIDFESILKVLKSSDEKAYNLLMTYYLMHRAFEDEKDSASLLKGVDFLRKNLNHFSREENTFLFFLSITFCINQTNKGRNEFYKILFNLINEKIKHGYIDELSEDNIPVNNFRDYVIIALRLGELEWIKKFVKDFSHMLPERYREDEISISLGLLKIEEKKYEEAIVLFNKVKKSNYLHYIDTVMNKIRAYYMMGYFDEVSDEIRKIRNYFSYRKDIPDMYKKKATNQLKDIEQLIKYEFEKLKKSDLEMYFRDRELSTIRLWVRQELEKMKIKYS